MRAEATGRKSHVPAGLSHPYPAPHYTAALLFVLCRLDLLLHQRVSPPITKSHSQTQRMSHICNYKPPNYIMESKAVYLRSQRACCTYTVTLLLYGNIKTPQALNKRCHLCGHTFTENSLWHQKYQNTFHCCSVPGIKRIMSFN